MIQITSQTRVLVATGSVDGRLGIDGLAQVCRSVLASDPQDGTLYIFRNRSGKSLRILAFDGQGFWCCTKRLSKGTFRHWPEATGDSLVSRQLLAHELQTLIWGGNPEQAEAAPMWRRIPVEPRQRLAA
jgi:transposase